MTEPTELEPAPTEVADLAESCVRFVKESLHLELDYAPETLPLLDHYVRERVADSQPEVIELIAHAAGAYFGEVVRRCVPGARWHAPASDYADFRLEFDPFFLCFNPIGIAHEVIAVADVAGWGAHFQVLDDARAAVAESLASVEDVPPEDYYTFSMRLEVLQQIADVLGGLETTQPARRRFGRDVYAAAAGAGIATSIKPS
jgi:Family of unknown function (DUF6278)